MQEINMSFKMDKVGDQWVIFSILEGKIVKTNIFNSFLELMEFGLKIGLGWLFRTLL